MKKAIYTVNLSSYDHDPVPPKTIGWHKILFTDSATPQRGWDKVIKIPSSDNSALEARRYKWLSHIHLKGYDLACYFDANMRVIRNVPSVPFRIRHHRRDNVRQECDALNKLLHRCTPESVENQWNHYLSKGFDDSKELWLNGFFCRDHSEKENKLCESVWEIINEFTPRDQLALPYAMWLNDYKQKNRQNARFFIHYVKMTLHKNLTPELHGSSHNPGRS